MATLVAGDVTITPTAVYGYEAESEAQTVLHRHLDGSLGVSLNDDLPRAGTLPLVFDSEADAWAAHTALLAPAVWTFTHPEISPVGMTFVRSGRMRIAIDDTRGAWLLNVGYQEVVS